MSPFADHGAVEEVQLMLDLRKLQRAFAAFRAAGAKELQQAAGLGDRPFDLLDRYIAHAALGGTAMCRERRSPRRRRLLAESPPPGGDRKGPGDADGKAGHPIADGPRTIAVIEAVDRQRTRGQSPGPRISRLRAGDFLAAEDERLAAFRSIDAPEARLEIVRRPHAASREHEAACDAAAGIAPKQANLAGRKATVEIAKSGRIVQKGCQDCQFRPILADRRRQIRRRVRDNEGLQQPRNTDRWQSVCQMGSRRIMATSPRRREQREIDAAAAEHRAADAGVAGECRGAFAEQCLDVLPAGPATGQHGVAHGHRGGKPGVVGHDTGSAFRDPAAESASSTRAVESGNSPK